MSANGSVKVLIVEDDPYLGMMMKECFEDRGFVAEHAKDGLDGFNQFTQWKPDICVLDVMMPHKDGFSLAREIRSIDKDTPFLFTTARSMKQDVLEGFKVGADDYLKKPFSMEELIVRVKVILKRYQKGENAPETPKTYTIGQYTFHYELQTLNLGGTVKTLTAMEADLLQLFCINLNQTVDRSLVLKTVWGDDSYFNARSMDVFISRLRKYLKDDPGIQIVNVRGKGFKLIYFQE